jgi:hypothetical protein
MFSEHGDFDVNLRGNILFLYIQGAWNIETSVAYQEAISEAIKPVIGKNWAAITLMDDWELCTPDSESVLFEIIKDAISKGLTREAVVNSKGTIKLQLFEKYHNVKTPNDTNIPFKRRIYQDEEEALQWLATEGFSIDHET